MIYRDMPAVWDPAFRPRFYASWGKENAVISARIRRVEYPEYRQLLSIKAAWGGAEHYYVDRRRLAVDDDTYLILNAGRIYGSRIDEITPVHSFTIFFAPNLAERALKAVHSSAGTLLDNPDETFGSRVQFEERLREHDRFISPHLARIRARVDTGSDDELWLEEELHALLTAMCSSEYSARTALRARSASRPAARAELNRRLALATDFIHSNYRRKISLQDIAGAAHLSPFHFLRLFKSAFQSSPSAYLNRRRTIAAERLIRKGDRTLMEVAEMAGFGSRTTLYRHLRAQSATRQKC